MKMKILFRLLLVCASAAAALATPTISITSPASGSTVGSVSTPAGTTITATAAATAGAGIASVQFFDNGVSIGTVGGTSPFSIAWVPSSAGAHTLTATVTDNSVPTTGTTPSVNMATATSIISIVTVRTVTVAAPANNASFVQDSDVFFRGTATLSNAIVTKVEFFLDGSGTAFATKTQAPYNVPVKLSAANGFTVGAHTVVARATATDGSTVDSATTNVLIVAPLPGNQLPTVTLTAPVAGATLPVNQNVTVTANASDTDGFIPGSAGGGVTFYADGDPIGTAVVPPYSITWRPTVSKAYVLRAQTTDDKGATVFSPEPPIVNVTVVDSVAGATAALTAPSSGSTVSLGATVPLTATASASTGGTVSKVDFFAGATLVGTDTTAPYSFSWVPAATGAVSLTARVTDSNGAIVTSTGVSVTVAAAAPTVAITVPTNGAAIALGTSTTLTATATGGGSATVNKVEFLAGATVVGTALTSPFSIAWTPTSAGIIALTARATDTSNATATSGVVNVNVQGPSVALTAPSAGSSFPAGTAVTLEATASAIAPATVTKVEFLAGSTLVGTATSAPYSVGWTPTATGTVSLTARVTDSNGGIVTGSATSITVTAAPTAGGSISISAPANGTNIRAGTSTAFTASVVPGSLPVSKVDFLVGTTLVGTAFTAPYVVTWTPANTGAFTVTARLIDTANATVASAVVNVVVVPATRTVTVTAPADGATVAEGSYTVLRANAAFADGIVSQVEFLVDGALVGSSFNAPYYAVAMFPSTGNSSVIARATGSDGVTTDSPAIVVHVAPKVGAGPVVGIDIPISAAFLPTGLAIPVSGRALDSDGTVTSVQVLANGVVVGAATVTGANWTLNWTPATQGFVTLTAIATDDKGNTNVAPPVIVNVTDSNTPAITLSLTPGSAPATTMPAQAFRNVVATVAPAPGRAIVRVEFFLNGTKIGEDALAPYNFRLIAPSVPGNYVLSARATDNIGGVRDTQVAITVGNAVGLPPAIALVSPVAGATAVPGGSVTLAASASAPGGSIGSVQFYVNGGTAALSNGGVSTGPNYSVTFTPPTSGSYVVDAIASDDRGNTQVSNSVTLVATFGNPTVAISSPASGAAVRATPNVPLNIAATALGGNNAAIVLVEFLIDGAQVGARTAPTTTNGSTYAFAWTPSLANLGARSLAVRATDANGQTATSTSVSVTVVNLVGTPPTVTLAAPTTAQATALQTLSTVNLVANAFASGTGNALTNVEFFLNDVSLGLGVREQTTNLFRLAANFAEFNFTAIAPDANGRYPVVLYAIARDTNGNQTISPSLALAINPSTSAAPTVQLTAQGSPNVTQGTPFLMTATPLDFDGVLTSLQLFVNGVASGGAIPNPAAQAALSFTPTAAGRFNLYVVATDDTGNTAVSSPAIVLTVTAVTMPFTQMVRPADNATVTTAGAPVFLEATASSPDTGVLTVTFVATAASGARTVVNATQVPNTTTYRAVWTPAVAGTYTVASTAVVPATTVSATSANSRRVVANSVTGTAPTITLNAPGNNNTFTTASTVNFTATAADFDGSVEGVEFFLGRNSVGQAVRDQLTNTWRLAVSLANVPTGTTDIVALARDNAGNVADPTGTTNINIVAATSIAPLVSISASTNNVAFSRQVQLTASARDTDGNVTNIQYFSNGTSIGNSGNAGTSYLVNWTPNQSGTFNVWATATDNSGNTTVAATLLVTVRPNNPVLDDDAFILQTYTDIANTNVPNALVFANLSAQFASGALTRAKFVSNLTAEAGFAPPVNLLAAYYAIMGQWPTPANYQTLLPTARNSLPNAIGAILSSPEYVAKFGPTPTAAAFNASYPTFTAFATRLWQNAGLGGPSTLQVFQFQNNDTLLPTLGRGYAAAGVGVNTAIAEFVTATQSGNATFLKQARAAALYYQLDKPPVTVTTDQIATRVAALAQLADLAAMADAVLQDQLYLYRYVTILTQPQSLTVAAGANAVFSVTAAGAPPLGYQWFFNGGLLAGATARTLTVTNVTAAKAGAYTVVVSSVAGSATSQAAVLGIVGTGRVTGASVEIARDVVHLNHNIYDQVLLGDDATAITADPGQITRLSFIDLTNDIVQVEFSGAGTLSLALENLSGPAVAENYNQPDVVYMKGHAGIVITGADATTNLTIFSVGRITAVNESLFKADVRYDGVADLAYVAILSADGKFGGLRTANASYFATKGYAGVFAPGVQFTGPVYIGDISAAGDATPVLLLGAASDLRIAGGDLFQANDRAVQTSGTGALKFVEGITSSGGVLPAQASRATFEQTGVEISGAEFAAPER